MTTQHETAVEVAFDILTDLEGNGVDIRGPQGSGWIYSIETHGSALQRQKLERMRLSAVQKHGAVFTRGAAAANADKDLTDRILRREFELDD